MPMGTLVPDKIPNAFLSDSPFGFLPLPKDDIYFVDSPYSEEFSLFKLALDRAYIVGMDAEWKPCRGRKASMTCPRVSIMQLACRLRRNEAEAELDVGKSEAEGKPCELLEECNSSDNECLTFINGDREWDIEQYNRTVEGVENSIIGNDVPVDLVQEESATSQNKEGSKHQKILLENFTNKRNTITTGRLSVAQGSQESILSKLKHKQEVVFLLDMMLLPGWSFWETMKRMLVSRNVLKLGFSFKQDLINLSGSFPGPDSHSCFDKVDPYIDIGRLYCELRGCSSSGLITTQTGVPLESLSLAFVCEQVLGYTLCKDLQCSDWERRPLTFEQMAYAARDAHCLLAVYDGLHTEASCQNLKGVEVSEAAETSKEMKRDGIAQLLLLNDPINLWRSSGNLTPCRILQACHGEAAEMVRSAVSGGNLMPSDFHKFDASSSSSAHMWIANKFGERLLVNIEGSKKLVRRKPKTRRGRDSGKNKGDQEVQSWSGPPPWDPSCGGDGCPKFLCDIMVEGLGKQLRNMGIDTSRPHVQKSDPRKLVEQAEREGRVLLTRDVKLLRRRLVPPNLAYRVRSLAKQDQLVEIIKIFNLKISEDDLLSRCAKCNGDFIPEPLTPEEAIAAAPQSQSIPEYAVSERLLFWQCSGCRHMYWQGNQFHRALEMFQALARKIQMETNP